VDGRQWVVTPPEAAYAGHDFGPGLPRRF